jgi:truncated hemoglobin YjbI
VPIDWTEIKYFKPSEFPEDPDTYADPALILLLDNFREIYKHPLTPSPAKGALARLDGAPTSRHYAVGRLSDAVDVFPKGDVSEAWLLAVEMEEWWGGIGLYPFTHPGPMLHLDLRPLLNGRKTLWARDKDGAYVYPNSGPEARRRFIELLSLIAAPVTVQT